MHIAFASTYPPRACGLATFARDLRCGLLTTGATAEVVSVVREYAGQGRAPEAAWELRQETREDYAAAAEWLNASGAEVLSVQHEFGIFGGRQGLWALDLMEATDAPVVTTLHTVLPTPEPDVERALRRVAAVSDRLVVMTETARELLGSVYRVSAAKVDVIPHGSPERDPTRPPGLRQRLGLEGRTVLLTFGLLGPSKGIEFALEALPQAVAANPDVLYVVLGATHPEIVRREGEGYREGLQAQVKADGLAEHVRFVDRYVDNEELWDWLRAADVYVSPYPGMDQICSGTLAYALGAGLPVVSTPYLHAREALRDGRGLLAPADDPEAFGAHLAALAADPERRQRLAGAALAFGRTTTWPQTGAAYRRVFERALEDRARTVRASGGAASGANAGGDSAPARPLAPEAEPRPSEAAEVHPGGAAAALDYLARLTDETGPVQHATHGIPDRTHGYSADDAGRALAAALWAAGRPAAGPPERRQATEIARTCLAFLVHAQRPDGRFHNFMGYDRRWRDDIGGEDTQGRALWGLGVAAAEAPEAATRALARERLLRTPSDALAHPRAVAYAALGMDAALAAAPGLAAARDRLRHLAQRLAERFEEAARPGWRWFCGEMTYANAIPPLALLRAGDRLGDEAFTALGRETLDFVLAHTLRGGVFEAVGNRGWLTPGGRPAAYDQQPVEAGYTAHACAEAFRLTGEVRYAEAARAAAEWFYGRNRAGQPLFYPETGASFDGLHPGGVNLNQGAESAIACLMAHLAYEAVAGDPTATIRALAAGTPAPASGEA